MTTTRRFRSGTRRTGFAVLAIALVVWWLWGGVAFGPPRHAARHVVRMTGMAFVPAETTVAPGDTIVWYNDDIVAHTATASRGGQWDTGVLSTGDSGKVVASVSGPSVLYYCRLHPTMTASVVVR